MAVRIGVRHGLGRCDPNGRPRAAALLGQISRNLGDSFGPVVGVGDLLAFGVGFGRHCPVAIVCVANRAVFRIGRALQVSRTVIVEGPGLRTSRAGHADLAQMVERVVAVVGRERASRRRIGFDHLRQMVHGIADVFLPVTCRVGDGGGVALIQVRRRTRPIRCHYGQRAADSVVGISRPTGSAIRRVRLRRLDHLAGRRTSAGIVGGILPRLRPVAISFFDACRSAQAIEPGCDIASLCRGCAVDYGRNRCCGGVETGAASAITKSVAVCRRGAERRGGLLRTGRAVEAGRHRVAVLACGRGHSEKSCVR